MWLYCCIACCIELFMFWFNVYNSMLPYWDLDVRQLEASYAVHMIYVCQCTTTQLLYCCTAVHNGHVTCLTPVGRCKSAPRDTATCQRYLCMLLTLCDLVPGHNSGEAFCNVSYALHNACCMCCLWGIVCAHKMQSFVTDSLTDSMCQLFFTGSVLVKKRPLIVLTFQNAKIK